MTQPTILSAPARDFSSRNGQPILAIVVHATAGTNSLSWLSGNPSGTSIHVLIRKDGTCYRMVFDDKAAGHCGFSDVTIDGVRYARSTISPNKITLGIELENLNNGADPYPEAQLRSCAWWIDHWQQLYGPLHLLFHRDIDTQGKTDPRGLKWEDILRFRSAPPPATNPVLPSVPSEPGPETPVLSPALATEAKARAFLLGRGESAYTDNDKRLITSYYWKYAPRVGLEPTMVFAQMIHETGALTSWWSLRPRRNPAGLGVTGEANRHMPPDRQNWAYNTATQQWERGHSFVSWDLSVQAQLGHLLLYAVPAGQETPAQRDMIAKDPRAPVFPATYRGVARVWRDLNGRWAVPGTTYADRISDIARAIARRPE